MVGLVVATRPDERGILKRRTLVALGDTGKHVRVGLRLDSRFSPLGLYCVRELDRARKQRRKRHDGRHRARVIGVH